MISSTSTQEEQLSLGLSVYTDAELAQFFERNPLYQFEWDDIEQPGLGVLPSGKEDGFLVKCEQIPGRAFYMKPGRYVDNTREAPAAREKIASDLAFC